MAKGVRVNRPKKALQRNHQKLGRVNKQRRKKENEAKHNERTVVIDPLTTTHILKKRRTNPKANITLSSKKRRFLTKQIQKEKARENQMEVAAAKKEKQPEKIKGKGSKQNEKMEIDS